jgi:putative S-adenosyl-L-methionine-dependent methyltransferase
LSGPGGFFEVPPIGADGDFVTSPHVHPVFARLLATAVEDLRERLGDPRPFRLTEVGAGDGTLARGLLDHVARAELEYATVETSPGALGSLAGIDGVRVSERLEGASHVILANELMDNLPFRRLRGTSGGPREVLVGIDGDRFVERLAETPAEVHGTLEDGEELTVPDGALRFVDVVAARVPRTAPDRGSPRPAGDRGHHVRRRLRAPRGARGARRPRRVPLRHPTARPHRPRLRPVDPGRARHAGGPAERRRRTRRGPDVEREEPGDAARRPLGARPLPLAPAGDPRIDRSRMDLTPPV